MRTPSRTRVFGSLAWLVVTLSAGVVACLGWAYQFERPYLSYQNLPFPAGPTVRAGEAVELTVERCNRSDSRRSYLTTHSLRNQQSGQVELLPEGLVDIEPGCTSAVSRINLIPRTTAPGVYTLSGVARVEGMVMLHRVPWTTTPFEVLPAAPDKEK